MFQTSVNQSPEIGLVGQWSDTTPAKDAITVFAQVVTTGPLADPVAGILPGHLTVVGSTFDQARLPNALAVDPDAVIATGDSSTTVYSGVTLDGVLGGARWAVPTLLDFVIDSHTDWDATNATLIAVDGNGATVTELLAIPDDGNATVASVGRYVQVISFAIPAQTGANGTFTLGVQGPASAALTKAVIQGWIYNDQHREGTGDINGISTGPDGLPFATGEDMAAMRLGRFWVRTENAVTRNAPVFVRLTNTAPAGEPSNIGQARSDADSGNAALVPGARFRRVDNLRAEIEFDAKE